MATGVRRTGAPPVRCINHKLHSFKPCDFIQLCATAHVHQNIKCQTYTFENARNIKLSYHRVFSNPELLTYCYSQTFLNIFFQSNITLLSCINTEWKLGQPSYAEIFCTQISQNYTLSNLSEHFFSYFTTNPNFHWPYILTYTLLSQ